MRSIWFLTLPLGCHSSSFLADDKQILEEQWRDWPQCARRVQDDRLKRIMEFLVQHPGDFRRAFALIDARVRRLYLAAFQSSVWNELLASHLRQACSSDTLGEVVIDGRPLPFLQRADQATLAAAQTGLPLPSARLHLTADPRRAWIEETVRKFGLELREMRVKYPRDSFFSKGSREALFAPSDTAWSAAPDDLYHGRYKLELRFRLPRGSYATLLLKTMAAYAGELSPSDAG